MKKTLPKVLLISLFYLSTSCSSKTEKVAFMADPHSFSNPEAVVITHLDWTADVQFTRKTIRATARLVLQNHSNSTELILDTKDLTIYQVTIDNEKEPVNFQLTEPVPVFGSALKIPIKPSTRSVSISYETSPSAGALQWLNPEQTSGKKHPFLFTQSQAILARTWIPLQDRPQVRFTYSATVTVPVDLMALMSAENPTEKSTSGVYSFKMSQPIPSYLMALAVGDLNFQSIGRNSGVYAEPTMLDQSVWEFADTQKMIDEAEKLYGQYRWDRYDLLVLPPSFPFGGMENPRLTFATPTIIAGDRSLVSLVAHELAHSWSGNLVTNATWDDFWLNEGFTTYFQGRIMEAVYGKEFAAMEDELGYQGLVETIESLSDNLKDTHLKLDLVGRDPDDGLTEVAYEKGAHFLRLIEQTVGRENFDQFLSTYFSTYAFKTMTTESFLDILSTQLLSKNPDWEKVIQVNRWVFSPGLPDNCPRVVSTKLNFVQQQIDLFTKEKATTNLQTDNWSTQEWQFFLRGLPRQLDKNQLTELDKKFKFSHTGNAEIAFEWFILSIKNDYQDAFPQLDKFLTTIGRRKFVAPLYRELAVRPNHKEWALTIYKKARPMYHSVTYTTIDGILGVH